MREIYVTILDRLPTKPKIRIVIYMPKAYIRLVIPAVKYDTYGSNLVIIDIIANSTDESGRARSKAHMDTHDQSFHHVISQHLLH